MTWVDFVAHVGSVALLVVLALACARPSPPRVLVLEISNQLGRTIAEIRQKPCDDLEMAFEPIEDSRIAPGTTLGIQLPASCVDIVAYDGRGRVVGEQRNLKMLPGASWVLRK